MLILLFINSGCKGTKKDKVAHHCRNFITLLYINLMLFNTFGPLVLFDEFFYLLWDYVFFYLADEFP